MDRPGDLFDREQEWSDLSGLVSGVRPGLQIGIVSGRRRQGKSYLLRRAVQARDGIYALALEEERLPALRRFGRVVAGAAGIPGELALRDWSEALRLALRLDGPGPGRLVVLDEFPYLLRTAPELASAVQALHDEARDGPTATLVLCGSAFSVMSELLSGARPLRGRARMDLVVRAFDYRTARRFWGVDDLDVALRLDAVLGGTPGYRDLTDAAPRTASEFDGWLVRHLLNPAHALFGEPEYLLREDPRITDRALYQSVLAAVAGGASTPSTIATVLGRDSRSLSHALDVLRSAGFVTRSEDVLTRRRPTYLVADPVLRFALLVVRPRQAMYEERRAAEAWAASDEVFAARVLGPHFEELSRIWTRRYASVDSLGGDASIVGSAVVNDPAGRARHELDVVALAGGEALHAKAARIRAIGEAKSTRKPRDGADLSRLEQVRRLLVARGHDAAEARLLLFSRTGFTAGLIRHARIRVDVELIDLERLYTGD